MRHEETCLPHDQHLLYGDPGVSMAQDEDLGTLGVERFEGSGIGRMSPQNTERWNTTQMEGTTDFKRRSQQETRVD